MISPNDITKILNVLISTPNIDHNIIEIEALTKNRVRIKTGYIAGIECGRGNTVYFEKKRTKWILDDENTACWVS